MKYRVVTYDLVDHYSEPHDVAVDPHGIAWVGERRGNKLGRFDANTLEFTEIKMPPGPTPDDRASLGNPQIDAHGILWVNDGPNARWLSYDTKTGKFLAFAWPKGRGSAGGNSMALHPDGTIWATGGNEARMLDPATAQFKIFEPPSAKAGKRPGSYGIAVAGDGSVWWAEPLIDVMARIDPVTGATEEFKIPDQAKSYPRRVNSDGNGDICVANWMSGKLMKIDHKSRQMTLYSSPSGPLAGHYSVSVDKRSHLVWASEHQVDKIARFDPKTEEWLEFPMPVAESDLRRIEIDPTNPNRVFFAGNTSGRVGFMEFLP